MKQTMKQWIAAASALMLILSMTVLPAAATPVGGGAAGTAGIKAYGVDLSFWNVGGYSLDYTMIDFEKMKADGCDFVILKAGGESSDGTNYMDPAFPTLYENAREAGLDIGAYFYALATTYAGAYDDARWCIELFEQYDMQFEYPIYYDVEDPGDETLGRPGHDALNAGEMTTLALGWAQTMETSNYFPGVYSDQETIDKLQAAYTDYYDVWYAYVNYQNNFGPDEFVPEEQDWSHYCGLWQYSWLGHYDGVALDDLDVDVAYKDYPTIMATSGYNNIEKIVVPSQFTVTFNANGGSAVTAVTVTEGNAVAAPTAPTKLGYTFGGWYADAALTKAYDFTVAVTDNLTLYAKWSETLWAVNNDLMPKDGQLIDNAYNDAGEGIETTYNADGTVKMTSTVSTGWAWPSSYMVYQNSVDLNKTPYLYLKKSGTSNFNLSFTVLTAAGQYKSVTLADMAGLADGSVASGEQELLVDAKTYLEGLGYVPESGQLKYISLSYFVLGMGGSYTTIDQLAFVAEKPVTALTSSTFTVGEELITGAAVGTTVQAFVNGIDQKEAVAVYTADGKAAADTAAVTSGMTVAIEQGGQTVRTYKLAVRGDVNADGAVNSSDTRMVLMLLTADADAPAWQAAAGDYDADSAFNTTDARLILTASVA